MDRPTILITGSGGFLGRAIAEALRDRYRIIGLDVRKQEGAGGDLETIEVDLASRSSVNAALAQAADKAGGRFASVIHLAAYYDTTGEEDPRYDSVTVQGTRRLLHALKRLGTEQFIFASTLLVHAPSPDIGIRITEQSPIDPAWAYPRSKAETEALIGRERDGVRTVILRLAGVYDEDCRATFIAQQIARIFERLPTAYLFTGNLKAGQPYLHKDDLVDAVVRAVDRRADLDEHTVLLIGEEDTPSYEELQKRLGRLIHGEEWRTLSLPKGLTKAGAWVQAEILDQETDIKPWMIEGSDDHYEIDTSRARAVLGWEPRHALTRTLPEMIRRLKQDPTDWYEKNRLEPAAVAASEPELRQAERRLRRLPEEALRDAEATIARDRRQTSWASMVNAILGAWLMLSPLTIGLLDPVAASPPPALGHELDAPRVRNAWLGVSEMASGAMVILVALLGMGARRHWMQWMTAAVGLWVMLAPLVFWTTSAAAYATDTIVGMLIVTFAVIVPPPPGIHPRALASDDDRPLGWSYSPSSFSQRIPIVGMAFVGFFISRYLAAYQLGHIEGVWDPFFGGAEGTGRNGTEAVVTSWVSQGFPVADAGLGAVAYGLDILAGAIGDRRRWRTMPWMVFLFGLLIIPLGAVSVAFIIIQPPLIGALCTLCIVQAAVTVVLIPYSIDEVLASIQYLWRARRAGEPFWQTFWKGGPALSEDQVPQPDLDRSVWDIAREFFGGGMTFPWTLVASVALGALLTATPVVFGTKAPLYFSDHIVGCLVIAVAVVAMAEVARPLRFANAALGAWVAAAPFLLDGGAPEATAAGVVMGLALVGLSLPRGRRSDEHYGGWDRAIV
ncbi:NAD-dependent epimerase/dehydratase family protein [Roseomonas sp. JC162]|uniref:NAD-dependent epimerase/dehydratase family protein n=1 Tax=Neoroseomonas marina TaxID=1232220 RepID=A0A848EAC6_9PROT|nr:NAD-dependent epimerase/dehydratase family protein [Neoroseomonas marina]NMJ41441.1 NAD-dependent epimerase/dehydratase family protein [Neoroseomonas marina]